MFNVLLISNNPSELREGRQYSLKLFKFFLILFKNDLF